MKSIERIKANEAARTMEHDQKYYRAEWMTDEQWACWKLYADVRGGFHHVSAKPRPCGEGIKPMNSHAWRQKLVSSIYRLTRYGVEACEYNAGLRDAAQLVYSAEIPSAAPAAELECCEHCGGTDIYHGPPECPGCGAPNCCQTCCREENQTQRRVARAHEEGVAKGAAEMLQRCIEAQCRYCAGGDAPVWATLIQSQGYALYHLHGEGHSRCDAWRLHDLKASLPTPALDQGEVADG